MNADRKFSIGKAVFYLVMLVLVVMNVYPLIFSILCAFKGNLEIFKSFTALPKRLRFENYVTAWNIGNIGRYFFNTLVLAAGTLTLSTLLGSLASYILAKFQQKSMGKMYTVFVSGMMIPMQAVLIPLSYVFGKLGIINNYPMLILLYTGFCLPMTILVLTGTIRSIPTDLEEATVMDGGNTLQVFWHVILPLSKPGIISACIFNFISVWNNLLFPLIFITDRSLGTISMGLLSFFGEYSTDYSASMAGICLTTIPVIILYSFFQDKIENGLMSGALKG